MRRKIESQIHTPSADPEWQDYIVEMLALSSTTLARLTLASKIAVIRQPGGSDLTMISCIRSSTMCPFASKSTG
jgi:hypothetical protein